MNNVYMSDLLTSLFGARAPCVSKCASQQRAQQRVQQHAQQRVQQRVQQSGGDYSAQHARKGMPLPAAAIAGRDAWIAEVRAVKASQNVSHKEAMMIASDNRKRSIPGYVALSERNLRGRSAASVLASCKARGAKACPGAYDRPAGHYAKRSHRPLSLAGASRVLRSYYRNQGLANGNSVASMKSASRGLRQDISRKRALVYKPCPTRPITYMRKGKSITRNIVSKNAECQDNWLFRTPKRSDMEGVDYGTGRASSAYGKPGRRAFNVNHRA